MIWGSILSLLKKAQCCKIDPLLKSSTFLEYNDISIPVKTNILKRLGIKVSLL